jgi:hypothetical protein
MKPPNPFGQRVQERGRCSHVLASLGEGGVLPPSRLMARVASLAYARVVVRSTVRILSSSSVGLCWGNSYGWATMITCLPVILPHRCTTSCSASTY